MRQVEKTVFISYRRTNAPWALAIFQNLTQHGYDVFFDFEGIGSGDFERAILENINARAHFLVLLTPSALERCDEPGDWLRREIEAAVDSKRNIVPLMLEGFDFSTPAIASRLTGKLAILKNKNALAVPAPYFAEAMARLREKFLNVPLDAVLQPASSPAQQSAKAQQAAARTAPVVNQKELTAQEWFEQGFNAVDPDEKLRCYSEAIHIKPDYADAYNNRGVARQAKGDIDGARKDFAEAIRLKPDYAKGAPRLPVSLVAQPSASSEQRRFVHRVRVLWERPIYKVTVIGVVLSPIAGFFGYLVGGDKPVGGILMGAGVVLFLMSIAYRNIVDERTTTKIADLSRSYLKHFSKQDAGKLAEMAETPFFFGETVLNGRDAVQNYFETIFRESQTDRSEKAELGVAPAFYRGALLSRLMVKAAELPSFDIVEAAEISVTLNIYSSNERQKPTGPEPTLDLREHAARAEIRVKGFQPENLKGTYLYFAVRNGIPSFRGVLLR